jgi:hypothetical protein
VSEGYLWGLEKMSLLKRQQIRLGELVEAGLRNPTFVIIHDTQSVPDVAEVLGVTVGQTESIVDGVAWFRLSNDLPDGERLVNRIKEAIPRCSWVFVHTGCSICPEAILELFEFIRQQEFDTPRIMVVGEHTDVVYGDERMRNLFSGEDVVNLCG